MILRVLSTGSKANCYALEAGSEILLLDAGLHFRDIIRGLDGGYSKVVGVLLTHEHMDHARGIRELMKYGTMVYTSKGTAEALGIADSRQLKMVCFDCKPFEVGSFRIQPFKTEHDAVEPYGYIIQHVFTRETLLFATDTYYLYHRFPGLNYWLVECNHIRSIMDQQYADGELNQGLRKRLITSHMSLERLLDCLAANDLSKARKIVLLHLSDARSDEAEMVRRVSEATRVETVAAAAGLIIDLDMQPF